MYDFRLFTYLKNHLNFSLVHVLDGQGHSKVIGNISNLRRFQGKELPIGAPILPIFKITHENVPRDNQESLKLPYSFDMLIRFELVAAVILGQRDSLSITANSFNIVHHAYGVSF